MFLHSFASPPPCIHTCSHTLCLCYCVFPGAGNPVIVSLTADVFWCSFVCVCASMYHACSCVCARACPHRQAALTGSHDSQVRECYSRVFLSLSVSAFLALFFKYFCCWRLRRGNVTQYLLLHLLAASDSCTYFWSTAGLMQLPVCTAC